MFTNHPAHYFTLLTVNHLTQTLSPENLPSKICYYSLTFSSYSPFIVTCISSCFLSCFHLLVSSVVVYITPICNVICVLLFDNDSLLFYSFIYLNCSILCRSCTQEKQQHEAMNVEQADDESATAFQLRCLQCQ